MDLSQLQEELRNLAIQEPEAAIERLVASLDRSSSAHYNEALHLHGRFKKLAVDERKGTVDRRDLNVENNQIREAFFGLVDDLETKDIRTELLSESEQLLLEELLTPTTTKRLIAELDPHVHVATTLYYVNCDREHSIDRVFDFFENFYDEQRPYQFYFFSACSTQRPRSFSERLVYEIEGYLEDMEGGDQAFRYWPTPKNERVEPFELPVGRNLRASKIKFKKLLAEKLEFSGRTTIETYLKMGKPTLDYKAIAMCFVFREADWKDFIPDYFQWIIETFDQAEVQRDCPTFLFFFAIDVMGIHAKEPEQLEGRKKRVYEELEALVAANPASTVHLSRLMPVPKPDVKAWMAKLGIDNDAVKEQLIRYMISQQTLSPEDRRQYIEQQVINMDDIELFQKWLLQYADEKGRGF